MTAGDGTGETMRQVGWPERQVRRADRFQQRHAVIAFPWAVAQKFGNDQAGGKAALMAYYGPRSVTQPPLTRADRLVLVRLAQMEVRRPEEEVAASFTDEADEDPLGGRP
jgi:hypothetical protein